MTQFPRRSRKEQNPTYRTWAFEIIKHIFKENLYRAEIFGEMFSPVVVMLN